MVPQDQRDLGPCAGGAVYSPAITDFVLMVEGTGNMFITGPDVIRSVTGEQVSAEALGGAAVHAATSGVAHLRAASDEECLAQIRTLLGYLPSNNAEEAPLAPSCQPNRLAPGWIPSCPTAPQSYDMRQVIRALADEDSFF